jgi:hypothetical protein
MLFVRLSNCVLRLCARDKTFSPIRNLGDFNYQAGMSGIEEVLYHCSVESTPVFSSFTKVRQREYESLLVLL